MPEQWDDLVPVATKGQPRDPGLEAHLREYPEEESWDDLVPVKAVPAPSPPRVSATSRTLTGAPFGRTEKGAAFNPLIGNLHPEIVSTLIRTGPALAGGMAGARIGAATGQPWLALAGGGVGSVAGYVADQLRTGREINPLVASLEGLIGAIPGGKTASTMARNIGKRALLGLGLGAGGGTARIGLEEGRLPTLDEILAMSGTGAVMGGALGGVESKMRGLPSRTPTPSLPPAEAPDPIAAIQDILGGYLQQSGKKAKPDKVFKKLSSLPSPEQQVRAFDNAAARAQIGKMGSQPVVRVDVPPELLAVSKGEAPAFLLPPAAEGTVPTAGEQALAGQDIPALARKLNLALYTSPQDGTRVLYRAKAVPRATLTALDKEGRLAEVVNGPGTSPKPVAPTDAVVARTPEGTEIRTVLTDTPETTAAAVKAQPAGTQVEVTPASQVGDVIQERMALLRNEVDDARTNLPTGKIYGTTEGETGMIQKHAIGAGKSIREQLSPLFPELNDLPNVGPKQIVEAIDKDRNNTLYVQIKDAIGRQVAREANNPAARAERPTDFDEFSRFVDDLAGQEKAAMGATPAVKQPWEMTAGEYKQAVRERTGPKGQEDVTFLGVDDPSVGQAMDWFAENKRLLGKRTSQDLLADPWGHKVIIKNAIAEGKPVPPEVLAEYPALAKQATSPPLSTQPKLFQTQAELPPTPLQPKAPQVEHGALLAGMKPQEPTRQAGLPLKEGDNIVEMGMGLPIPKSVRKAARRFLTGEIPAGARAHGLMNDRDLLNTVLGVDPETNIPIGDLVNEGYLAKLRHAGRHDSGLSQAKLDALNDAEALNFIHVARGQARPMNQKVQDAVNAVRSIDKPDADLMEKGGQMVLRDAVYDTKTGAKIRDAQYKPFQRQQNYYHEVLDPRRIVTYSPEDVAKIIRTAPYAENRAIDAATAKDMAAALLARAKGEVVPSSIGANAKRILRLGQPTAAHLHERNKFWRIPDEFLMRPKDSVPLYSDAATRELGWLETLGPGYRKIESAIAKARESGRPDVEMAVRVWDDLRGGAIHNPLDTTLNKWVQLGKSGTTATLLNTFTGIKQFSQGFRLLGSDIRWRSSLGQMRHAVSRMGMEESRRMGSLVDAVKSDMEMMNPIHEQFMPSDTGLDKAVKVASRTASAVVKAGGTVKTDSWMRSWATHAAKADALAYQREATQGSRKAAAMLKRWGLTPKSTAQEIDRFAQKKSLAVNYRADSLAIPGVFHRNTLGSLASTLNKFNIGVVSDLRQNFIAPTSRALLKKDWPEVAYHLGKTAKYLAMMGVGGEMITDTILTLRGRPDDRPGGTLPEFLDDVAKGRVSPIGWTAIKRYGENVANAGTFGALSLVSGVLSSHGNAQERAARITGTFGGAAVGTAAEIGGHVANLLTADRTPGVRSKKSDYDRAKEAAWSSAARRVPFAGVHLQDFLRHLGVLSGSKGAATDRAVNDIARTLNRPHTPQRRQHIADIKRDYRQRYHENISPQRLRRAMGDDGR